jgi:hypothetical protein
MAGARRTAGSGCGRLIGGRCARCSQRPSQQQHRGDRVLGAGAAVAEVAVKRWVRARLLSGTAPSSLRHYVDHLQAFSGWLAERTSEVSSPAQLTRLVLEDYMLAVRSSGLAAGTKTPGVGVLWAFSDEQREDGLAGLPRPAVIHAGEFAVSRAVAAARDRAGRV